MPSQFGGVAANSGSQFGGVPVGQDDQQPVTTGSTVGDFLAGVGGSYAQHALTVMGLLDKLGGPVHDAVNLYKTARAIPGADKYLPEFSDLQKAAADATPDNTPSRVGKFIESAGEYLVGGGDAAAATKGASLLARSGAQAAAAGATRAAQGGTAGQVADTAALGAAGPVVGDVTGAAIQGISNLVKNSPALQKIAPDLVGLFSPRARYAANIAKTLLSSDAPAEEKVAQAVETAKTQAADPLLDDIAKGQGYSSFKSAPGAGQKVIQMMAQSVREADQAAAVRATAKAAAPVTQEPIETPASSPQPATAAPSSEAPSIAEQLRDEMLKNGTITQEHLQPPVPEELTPEGRAALADTMRSVPSATRVPIAKAAYAGGAVDDSELAGATYEAAHRANRAEKLTNILLQHGVTSDEMPGIAQEHWDKLANAIGLNTPVSKETVVETIRQAQAAENVQAMHAAMERLRQSFTAPQAEGIVQ